VVLGRLERGCRAFAVWTWTDEAMASWVWLSTGEEFAAPVQRTLAIPEGDCYGWDGGTGERHRGRGRLPRRLEWTGRRVGGPGRGIRGGGILDSTLASRRACTRAGLRPVLRVVAAPDSPRQLRTWATDYADERLVVRARQLLGVGQPSSRARRAAA